MAYIPYGFQGDVPKLCLYRRQVPYPSRAVQTYHTSKDRCDEHKQKIKDQLEEKQNHQELFPDDADKLKKLKSIITF